ncbi:hypothetical protein [Haloferula sp. BvORR071]|uniref:hypothetical protein n=1 Tax=Haloferula sp. BvORR071 TaxID=1396141 RepID=UPI000557CB12|nr:hypothetical protein [Haloferula sp. BvORR071]
MKAKLLAVFLAAPLAHAATVTFHDAENPDAAGGIGYEWSVTLGSEEVISTPNVAGSHVGAWSWEDQGLFDPGDPTVGWTHTSQWAAITLTEAAYFTVRLEANGAVPYTGAGNVGGFRPSDNFFPSFTLYSGIDQDAIPDAIAEALGLNPADGENHMYNNRGNIDWAEDLTFVGLKENSTQSFAEATWFLPAGTYTLVMGSNAPSESNPPRQGFKATFTTAPEPSSALLGAFAAGLLVIRRRR